MVSEEDGSRDERCPLCLPRERADDYWIEILPLSVSTLYLDWNQTYRGQCALAFDPRHVEGLEHLSVDEYHALCRDLESSARAVAEVCQPDLMNYASLGNVVPHVHWHIIPRYRNDPRWGGPIYTTHVKDMADTRLSEVEYERLVSAIRAQLRDSA
jgi:ATP adenylyltransferase